MQESADRQNQKVTRAEDALHGGCEAKGQKDDS